MMDGGLITPAASRVHCVGLRPPLTLPSLEILAPELEDPLYSRFVQKMASRDKGQMRKSTFPTIVDSATGPQ